MRICVLSPRELKDLGERMSVVEAKVSYFLLAPTVLPLTVMRYTSNYQLNGARCLLKAMGGAQAVIRAFEDTPKPMNKLFVYFAQLPYDPNWKTIAKRLHSFSVGLDDLHTIWDEYYQDVGYNGLSEKN